MTEAHLSIDSTPRPRPHGADAGSYEQAIRVRRQVLDPGDFLEVEQYFTGYGEITDARFKFFPSTDLFDAKQSTITSGLKQIGSKEFGWGRKTESLATLAGTTASHADASDLHIELGGLMLPAWKETTSFFDMGGALATERKIGSAPIQYKLLVRKDVEPGRHYLEFYFTYFDGQKWRTSTGTKKVEFTVRNIFERHQRLIATIGLIGSILGIVRVAVTFFQ